MPNDGRCLEALGGGFVTVDLCFVSVDIDRMDKKSFAIGALSAALVFVTLGAGMQQSHVEKLKEIHKPGHPWVYSHTATEKNNSGMLRLTGVLLNKETGELINIRQAKQTLTNGVILHESDSQ